MLHHFKRYFPASYVIQRADTYVVVSDIEMCVCMFFFEFIEAAQEYPLFKGGSMLFKV